MTQTKTEPVNATHLEVVGTRYPAHRKALLVAMQEHYGDDSLSDTIRRCLEQAIVQWLTETHNG